MRERLCAAIQLRTWVHGRSIPTIQHLLNLHRQDRIQRLDLRARMTKISVDVAATQSPFETFFFHLSYSVFTPYPAIRRSTVTRVIPSTIACATSIRSNGSAWSIGKLNANSA